ncbi:efflux RND transporter periplasmic adaptor subunit [Rhizosphaericola mali]|uniref:Efflux RND transporter periplasmic adaptor subunit n=1 Tax=Rhizosphaericola mali TaxID=2545455 RepID=A0A5P2FXS7_9BACT|nr:efflux RND transporter periplasmic adaptor subunit [Rhizosphaericola mali]QES88286.1 efflux RND transporter periplasmic adaptor subunit [Rhizosphaericola mali]QES88947.1 efflux RND transporter periplasmic adaptor subunit [Rhizosphaericola mali]
MRLVFWEFRSIRKNIDNMKVRFSVNSYRFQIALLLAIAVFSLWSCGSKQNAQDNATTAAPKYKVYSVIDTSALLYTEYPATLKGVQDIEIRPKIDGYIDKVWVDEGQAVKKGQVLFTIRNPEYEQSLRSAAAAIESAKAQVASAKLAVYKTIPLVKKGIISNYTLQANELTFASQKALLAEAVATYKNAQVNLSYTTITSPVSGYVGTLPMKLGSYVSATSTDPLTTVSDINKIYAYFSISEKDPLFLSQDKNLSFAKRIEPLPNANLLLTDNDIYPLKGKMETVSGLINTSTGSFNIRAGFDNPQHTLRSGGTGTIRIPEQLSNAIVIPQSATNDIQGKILVYVLQKDSSIVSAKVSVKEVPGGQYYVVNSGLKTGDKILVEGVGIVAEGTKISPKLVGPSQALAVDSTSL